jgi:adenylylsulfate kinase-like enzyme
MVIWIIGLAGAGKTSVGRALHALLQQHGRPIAFLDGDDVREMMDNDLGHTLEDRRRNGRRMSRISRYLDSQGMDVVCATLSQFDEHQRWNRANNSRYFEVFLDVPMSVLEARDQRGLYSGARAGTINNVVGVDMPFPPPKNPDMVFSNSEDGPITIARAALAEITRRYPEWSAPA